MCPSIEMLREVFLCPNRERDNDISEELMIPEYTCILIT